MRGFQMAQGESEADSDGAGLIHLLALDLSERELHFIGHIVAQWGALEHEIFVQTLRTFADYSEELPKQMNNLQFTGSLGALERTCRRKSF
jgi:hypothetical protein